MFSRAAINVGAQQQIFRFKDTFLANNTRVTASPTSLGPANTHPPTHHTPSSTNHPPVLHKRSFFLPPRLKLGCLDVFADGTLEVRRPDFLTRVVIDFSGNRYTSANKIIHCIARRRKLTQVRSQSRRSDTLKMCWSVKKSVHEQSSQYARGRK